MFPAPSSPSLLAGVRRVLVQRGGANRVRPLRANSKWADRPRQDRLGRGAYASHARTPKKVIMPAKRSAAKTLRQSLAGDRGTSVRYR